MIKARAIAFYLPQFHPIPENDLWWGKGFTEWTNVTKAKPLFRGHYQPILPADLGFYDLRLPEVREAQASLARAHGIEAFCYYHYWFGGKRILERPFNEVLQSGEPDFPFCLCWANETWTGIWHGTPNKVLIQQTYPGDEDHRRHFEFLLAAFKDKRYLQVDQKPVFVIYRPWEIPNLRSMTNLWRCLAVENGLSGLYLVAHQNSNFKAWSPEADCFDAYTSVTFPARRPSVSWRSPMAKLKFKLQEALGHPTIYHYKDVLASIIEEKRQVGVIHHPCVVPNWDNTARSKANGLVLQGSTPDLFRKQLRLAMERISDRAPSDRILFIKSWNEWAEGNVLEPERKAGLGYLEVLRRELSN
jgi:hypothetical protein